MTYKLTDMSGMEAEKAFKERDTAVFPIGAVHPHGDITLGIDNHSIEEISNRLGKRMKEKIIGLPLLPYGYSAADLGLGQPGRARAGDITVSENCLYEMVMDVCRSIVKHGIKRIIFLNGHGPNTAILTRVAVDLMNELSVLSAVIDWWVLIGELKGHVDPTYKDAHFTEPDVDLALGKLKDATLLKLYESKVPNLHKKILGDKLIPKYDLPIATRIGLRKIGVQFEKGSVIIPLPQATPQDYVAPVGDLGDRVSASKGEDILETIVDYLEKFIEEFQKAVIPNDI